MFVYFYVALHLLSYAWFDMGFEVSDIAHDIAKRPFIPVSYTHLDVYKRQDPTYYEAYCHTPDRRITVCDGFL